MNTQNPVAAAPGATAAGILPPLILSLPHRNPSLASFSSENEDLGLSLEDRKKLVSNSLSVAPFVVDPRRWGASDITIVLSTKNGLRVPIAVHRQVLTHHSEFFRQYLPQTESSEIIVMNSPGTATREVILMILGENLEVYVDVIGYMYLEEMATKLFGKPAAKIFEVLEVCSSILFNGGVTACLEYLDAIHWPDDEENKMVSRLAEIHLRDPVTTVLQRVVAEPATYSRANNVFLETTSAVFKSKNETARRRMRDLMSRLLSEENSETSRNMITISKDTLYTLCYRCLGLDESGTGTVSLNKITSEADNLEWILNMLIDRRSGEAFAQLWAGLGRKAGTYSKFPFYFGRQMSRITALLCVAIGKGQILVSRETRYSLLSTWFEALCCDFESLTCRSVDKQQIEEGLGQMILTLSLPQQETILRNWLNIYLKKDGSPNLEKAYETWWRRSFSERELPQPRTDN